ncbi:MAG: GntR family transcriptional regulator [Pseudomonadota bacterium]
MKSRTIATYEVLKSQLLEGRFQPGVKLKIDEICTLCEASPGAVREALSRLTSDGLVVSIPQRGFIVAPISAEDLIDLTQVRIDIEVLCLRRSIEFGDLAWEGRIQAAWHQLKHTPMRLADHTMVNPEWAAAHVTYHDTLVEACKSAWWLKLRSQMFIQAERYRRMLFAYDDSMRDVESEHGDIVKATLDRNADLACKLLAEHAQRTTDHLLECAPPLKEALKEPAEVM